MTRTGKLTYHAAWADRPAGGFQFEGRASSVKVLILVHRMFSELTEIRVWGGQFESSYLGWRSGHSDRRGDKSHSEANDRNWWQTDHLAHYENLFRSWCGRFHYLLRL